MSYGVEKNIPIPAIPTLQMAVYPWAEMEVGDSFLVPLEDKTAKQVRAKVAPAAARDAERHKRRYTLRTVADGIRVWRTA